MTALPFVTVPADLTDLRPITREIVELGERLASPLYDDDAETAARLGALLAGVGRDLLAAVEEGYPARHAAHHG